MSTKRICYPRTSTPIITGNLQLDSTRVKGRKDKAMVPGQTPAAGPIQTPFIGPQLPDAKLPAPESVLPVDNGSGKTIVLSHTPMLNPKLRYEDITGATTRHHTPKSKSSTLAPKMPAAASLGRVHKTHKGAGITRRTNR
jgi:hypothetical protein